MKAGVAVTTTGLNGENEIIGDAGGNAGFRVFQQDRRLYFQAQGGGGKTAGVDMTAPDTERWIHVAGVFDGRALLYRNGILVDASAVGSASATGTRSLQIGRDTNISSSYWRGTLDEIQIFSRALSPAEVTALAQP